MGRLLGKERLHKVDVLEPTRATEKRCRSGGHLEVARGREDNTPAYDVIHNESEDGTGDRRSEDGGVAC